MIKIYDKNRNFIKITSEYKNARIQKEINITDTFSCSIPIEFGSLFEEEGYIYTKEGNFIIKEKNYSGNGYEIVGKPDLEEFSTHLTNKAYVTKKLDYIIGDLINGTGWTVEGTSDISRTVTVTNASVLEAIFEAIRVFRYEVRFDNVNKTIHVAEELGSDKGIYFTSDLNLKSLNINSDTYDFATRLTPQGVGGMGIELINNGKSYVENHEYSDKIVTVYWKDERYSVVENLKADAIKKLEKMAKPLKSYSCDIINLADNSDYSFMDFEIGDVITLIDKDTNTREKQRIVKVTRYPDNPHLDKVDIANRPRSFADEDLKEYINESMTFTNSKLEMLDDKIESEVSSLRIEVRDWIGEIDYEQIIQSKDEPDDPELNTLWLSGENILYRWNGEEWLEVGRDINLDDIYQEIDETKSNITQLADNISLTVTGLNNRISSNEDDIDDLDTRVKSVNSKTSSIELDLDSITSRVSANETNISSANGDITGIATRLSTAEQKITPSEIVSTVRSSSGYTNDLAGKASTGSVTSTNNRIDYNETLISQLSNSISSKVSYTDYTGNTIASLINQTATTIKLQASKISLEGAVTANDNFQIKTNGTIEATNAKISGNIIGTSGKIGGFLLVDDVMQSTQGSYGIHLSGGGNQTFPLWIGNSSFTTPTFSVKWSGETRILDLYCDDLTGFVNAKKLSVKNNNGVVTTIAEPYLSSGAKITAKDIYGTSGYIDNVYSEYISSDDIYSTIIRGRVKASRVNLEINGVDKDFGYALSNGEVAIRAYQMIPDYVVGGVIGNASYRYSSIYLTNNPNVSSDIRQKSSIQEIPKTLVECLKSLKPKMFFQNDKWHFGYIAQDVERILYKYAIKEVGFKKAKKFMEDFEFLHKDESYLSLIYAEIAVLKEAEYQDRLENLEKRLEDLENGSR